MQVELQVNASTLLPFDLQSINMSLVDKASEAAETVKETVQDAAGSVKESVGLGESASGPVTSMFSKHNEGTAASSEPHEPTAMTISSSMEG